MASESKIEKYYRKCCKGRGVSFTSKGSSDTPWMWAAAREKEFSKKYELPVFIIPFNDVFPRPEEFVSKSNENVKKENALVGSHMCPIGVDLSKYQPNGLHNNRIRNGSTDYFVYCGKKKLNIWKIFAPTSAVLVLCIMAYVSDFLGIVDFIKTHL